MFKCLYFYKNGVCLFHLNYQPLVKHENNFFKSHLLGSHGNYTWYMDRTFLSNMGIDANIRKTHKT